jgi:hypothetical protein
MHRAPLNLTRFADAVRHGLRPFPGKARSKEPAVSWKKFQGETPTAEQIANWDRSNYNVCIVTGEPSDVCVIDIDSPDAQELYDSLCLPVTPAVRTAKGRHYYFKLPPHPIRNAVRVGGVKLDVRGDGGYIIGAGSVHPSGLMYEWEISPDEVPFAAFPEELTVLLHASRAPKKPQLARVDSCASVGSTGVAGLEKHLNDELVKASSEVADATEGERNDTLFKMAARMARHVAAAEVDWTAFANSLAEAARSAGLDEDEIADTIDSGWSAGSEEPTAWIRVACEHVYLAYQERFYHIDSGKDLKPAGFNGQYGHLFWGKGSFAHFLLGQDYVRKVFDVTYEPVDPRRYIDREGLEFLNTFKSSRVAAVEGDPTPFTEFMSYLVPEQSERDHLMKMVAYTVRNPGRKLRHALLLRSAIQGVGKTMFLDIWGGLVGEHNVRKTTPKELAGDFQSYLRDRLLVVCEEMNLGMGFRAYNDLKDMVTANTALINEKHLRPRECRIYSTFVFLTNVNQPLFLEQHDRRFFYIDSPAQRRDPKYYKDFATWWQGNLGIVRNYIDGIDLSDFNPHEAPPMTEAKLRLITGSKSELAQELALAIVERQGFLDRDIVTLDQVSCALGMLVRRTKPQLAKALRELGALSLGQQRIGGSGRASLWAIRNLDYWRHADMGMIGAEFDRQTGIFAALDGSNIDVLHACLWPGDPALMFLDSVDPHGHSA